MPFICMICGNPYVGYRCTYCVKEKEMTKTNERTPYGYWIVIFTVIMIAILVEPIEFIYKITLVLFEYFVFTMAIAIREEWKRKGERR